MRYYLLTTCIKALYPPKIKECVKFVSYVLHLFPSSQLGWAPLHLAAFGGHVKMCALLLDRGGVVDGRARVGSSLLQGGSTVGVHYCQVAAVRTCMCMHVFLYLC